MRDLKVTIYIRGYRIFYTSRYQFIVKASVSGVFEDLKFKISEGKTQDNFNFGPSLKF